MFLHKIDEDLYLKIIDMRDAERVFELTNQDRDYLREWLPWVDNIKKVEDTAAFIEFAINEYTHNKSMNVVIIYKGAIVGVAGFNQLNWANKTAYIGYWLGKEYQGNGIMTKVAKALTNYAFYDLEMNKVEIRAALENKKSKSIPEKLSFVNEGCIRSAEWLYDHFVDHVVYGMLAEDWEK